MFDESRLLDARGSTNAVMLLLLLMIHFSIQNPTWPPPLLSGPVRSAAGRGTDPEEAKVRGKMQPFGLALFAFVALMTAPLTPAGLCAMGLRPMSLQLQALALVLVACGAAAEGSG